MTLFDDLNEENFVLFASRNYNNTQCVSTEEFYEDLARIKYIKRLFNRYLENDDLQERLILNHLIIFYNVFGVKPSNRMLFYKIGKKYWSVLKTFLVYLNYVTDSDHVDILLDYNIIQVLRKL